MDPDIYTVNADINDMDPDPYEMNPDNSLIDNRIPPIGIRIQINRREKTSKNQYK